MSRWKALVGLVTLALLMGLGSMCRVAAAGPPHTASKSAPDRTKYLEIYYSSPVLVRAGERVRMPVDVVCATARGRPCSTTVTLGTQVGSEPWSLLSAPAASGLQFDVTAPAARAVAAATSASVRFFLRAEDDVGRTVSLPPGGPQQPLLFFVTRTLRSARMPVGFGQVKAGTTALSLPWGSGPLKAGVELGRQSATRGPSGFDVDERGRLYVLDSLQRRLAAFDRGRLIASTAVSVGVDAAVAIGGSGRAVVLDRAGSSLALTQLDSSGRRSVASLGSGLASQVRVVRGRAFARTLPLDAWVSASTTGPSVGLPLPWGGQLIRVGREDRLRIGRVVAGRVQDAIELTPPTGVRLGEVALAESDRHGSYWVVIRVSRQRPIPADQYEVLRVADGRVLTAFAAGSHSFAEAPPLGRFVLGRDGSLFQMTSSPDGMRIVRFGVKEER
jgi:hypothetical protein